MRSNVKSQKSVAVSDGEASLAVNLSGDDNQHDRREQLYQVEGFRFGKRIESLKMNLLAVQKTRVDMCADEGGDNLLGSYWTW